MESKAAKEAAIDNIQVERDAAVDRFQAEGTAAKEAAVDRIQAERKAARERISLERTELLAETGAVEEHAHGGELANCCAVTAASRERQPRCQPRA